MAEIAELERRRTELEGYYSALRSRWVKDEQYYEGDFKIPMPAGIIHKAIPATGRNAIDIPSQHIITENPIVKRRRDVHGKRQAGGADDRVEAFYAALLKEVEACSDTPPLHEAVRLQLLRGVAGLTGPYVNVEKLTRGESGWLTFDAEDPAGVLVEPGPEPREVFFEYEATVAELTDTEEYAGFEVNGRRPTDVVTVVKWYGRETRDAEFTSYAWWEKERATWMKEPIQTIYRALPYGSVYSGYGRRTLGAKPEQIAVSILNRQVQSLLVEQAATFVRCGGAVSNSVWGQWSAPSQSIADQVVLTGDALSVMIVPEGVTRIQQEALPNAALQYLAEVNSALEVALFSGVLKGDRPTGVTTAAGLAILSGQARLKFGPPLRLLSAGLAQLLAKVGPILQTLTDLEVATEFEIAGHKVTASDFGGDYAVEVQLVTDAPEDRDRKVALGMQLQQAGAIPEEQIYADYYGIENYKEALKKRIKEKIILSDETQMMIKEGIGLARQVAMAKQQQGQPAAAQPGVDALAQMHAQARQLEATQPGTMGQVQQPGTMGDMVQAQEQLQGPQSANMGQPYGG